MKLLKLKDKIDLIISFILVMFLVGVLADNIFVGMFFGVLIVISQSLMKIAKYKDEAQHKAEMLKETMKYLD